MIELTVNSGHATFDTLVEEYAQRCDENYLVLDVGQSVAVGDKVLFSIMLDDGSVVFQGIGECAEAMMHEDDVDPAFRHRVILGALELDEESNAVRLQFLRAAGIVGDAEVAPVSEAPAMVSDASELMVSISPGPISESPMAADDYATSMQPIEEAAAPASVPPRESMPALDGESTSLVEVSADAASEREPSLPPPLPARVSVTPASIPPASIPPASVPPAYVSQPAAASVPPARASVPVSVPPETISASDVASIPPLAGEPSGAFEEISLSAPPRRAVSVAPAPPRPATGLRRRTLEPSWQPIAEAPVSSGFSSGLFAYAGDVLPSQAKAPRPGHAVAAIVPASALVGDPGDWATNEIDISSI